jgi:hypothetical protein
MNKLMIVLGLLLIAGLSFARPSFQYPWQDAVLDRYICHVENVPTEQYYVGYYMYQYTQPYILPSQMQALLDYTNGMQYYLYTGMGGEYYAAPFRADMGLYNSNNVAFRTVFNAMLRTYLAHGGDRAYVLDWLNGINQDYRNCLMPPP